MNNYPEWWDATLTVFNKYIDPQTQVVTWYRTVIENCFWRYVGDKVNVGNVVLETNNIICRIPRNDKFLENYQWITTPNDEMANYFTLNVGDIIVKGNIEYTINEYQTGHRSVDLIKQYKALQGCMTIQEVGINTGKGRCNEHYFVKGI